MMAWFSFCAIFPLLLWDAEKIRSPRRVAIAISGMVILALGYAFVCKITGSNIYHLKIGEFSPAPDIANIYMSANERFRVSSFFAHPMDFALMCSFSLLLIGLLREKGAVSKGVMILMFGLTAYGVMLGNSRLPMLLWLISVGVMFLFSGLVRLPIAVKFLTIMVALIAGLAFTSGGEDDFVGQTLRMFNSEQAVRGSSVGMRINQLGMSVSFASTRPIFGHGLGYISENMNFTVNEDGNAEGVEEDFAGFESILFSVPIEEGYLGLATYFFFYIAIGRIAMSMVGNPFRIYALAILGLFVVYQIGTGMLGSAPLAFVSIAVALALASHRDDANALNHSRQRAPAT